MCDKTKNEVRTPHQLDLYLVELSSRGSPSHLLIYCLLMFIDVYCYQFVPHVLVPAQGWVSRHLTSIPGLLGFSFLPISAGFCLVGQRLWKWLRRRTTLPVFEEAHRLCVCACNCFKMPTTKEKQQKCHGLS